MGIIDIFVKIFGLSQKENLDERVIKQHAQEFISREYQTFLQESNPEEEKGFTQWFRNACKFSYKTLKLKAPMNMADKLNQQLLVTELDVTPDQVFSLTLLTAILGLAVTMPFLLIKDTATIFLPILPLVFAYMFFTYPSYLSAVTKIKASDETVKVILYMVIYLRLNPQIEGALRFAAAHSHGPIGRDLKKIIWDLQVRRFITINEAISSKITKWLLWDKEFVESMNLIQALSLETSEAARERTLDKTLSYILESTYEKMKEYSRDLRTPIMLIHTMGITFPIMGLVMFPMISIFLHKEVNPYYLIFGYIGILPLFNYFYLRRTISKRPGAFSYPEISHHPDLPPDGKFAMKMGGKKYFISALPIALIVMFFVMIPGIAYFINFASQYYSIADTPDFSDQWKTILKTQYDHALEFSVYSLSVIWGISLGLIIYFYGTSFQRVKIRNDIKAMEDEFQIGLFRLSDVMQSGIPVETALEETLNKYKQYKLESSPMYSFFQTILKNIREMGMTLKKAVFDPNYGVMIRYPSLLIRDIMQVLVSASEKSAAILSTAARTISSFLLKTKNVENLLKELLDEVAAAISLQSNFIAPFIAGIVAAMATFIIQLLQRIADFLATIESTFNLSGTFVQGGTLQFGNLLGMIKIEEVIPATIFQVVVGLYMVETVVVLAYFLNGIRNGFDRTTRNLYIGKSLMMGLIFYSIVMIVGLSVSGSLFPAIGQSGGLNGIFGAGT